MNYLKKIFLNEHFILLIIVLNAIVIYAQESGVNTIALEIIDLICTFIFIVEMLIKHIELGVKNYWKNGWNRLDGTLVILSIPSVISFFVDTTFMSGMSILLVLRLLRVLRFFRIIHIFPNFATIAQNFKKALKDSYGVFVGFLILIVIFALISCTLFKESAPQYFGTPTESIYAIFRICTGEGWNEIPDTIAENMGMATARWIRLYFCFLLILCSIIGLSLVNSIFVDAMVSDNNNELEKQVKELNEKIDTLIKQINKQ